MPALTQRERVFAALEFRAPDKVPVEYHPSPAGVHEHGERLRELGRAYADDFNAGDPFPAAGPGAGCVDGEGRYRELRRDEWGVVWEHLIFGVAGHPKERPLDDWGRLGEFACPRLPPVSGMEFEEARGRAAAHQARHFLKSGWISIFETMHAVRRFEDVLMDLAEDRAEAHELADRITAYRLKEIEYFLARGVDAIQFGDDFGTQSAMMIAPKTVRRFFVPRYRRLMAPILAAGKKVFFHTCGCSRAILDDLAGLGVQAIWPQLNSYNPGELAAWTREARVAIALHPNRGDLMTRGSAEDVRRDVRELAETFRVDRGGGWFYVEIDAGFPWGNVETLIGEIGAMRS